MISELVGGEDVTGSPPLSAGVGELVHVRLVGRGEDVGRGALVICVTRSTRRRSRTSTLASGLAAVKAAPISVNASVSDAAANTVIAPGGVPAPNLRWRS